MTKSLSNVSKPSSICLGARKMSRCTTVKCRWVNRLNCWFFAKVLPASFRRMEKSARLPLTSTMKCAPPLNCTNSSPLFSAPSTLPSKLPESSRSASRGILRNFFSVDRKKRCETLSCVAFDLEESMKARVILISLLVCTAFALFSGGRTASPQENPQPRRRVILDAHNCYPYYEWWFDRIDRALSAGTPVAIEQDLLWAKNPRTGKMASVLSHGAPPTGTEPGMREYFFERVRPIVEKALLDGNHGDWPLITLNLDLKSEEPDHLQAIWALLSDYRDWLTTAARTDDLAKLEPLQIRPIMVLTGESDAQKHFFYDEVRAGDRLLVFGAVKT